MKSVFVFITASALCGLSLYSQDGTDLFFSEYIEGTGNNKALEIFNPGGNPISLSDYRIALSTDGGGWKGYHTFSQNASIPSKGTWVIVNTMVNPEFYNQSLANESILAELSPVTFNGNDARALIKISGTDTVVIDVIGTPSPNPGLGWNVAGYPDATRDHTLIRKPMIEKGNKDWDLSRGSNEVNSEWILKTLDDFSDLGKHNYTPFIAVQSVLLSSQSGEYTISGNLASLRLIAEVLPENASEKKLLWSSSSPITANVDQTGLVRAYNNGTAWIKATSMDGSGVSDSVQLTITNQNGLIPVQTVSLFLNPGISDTIKINAGTLQLQSEVLPSDATNKMLVWVSSDPGIAEVTSDGMVKGKRNGKVIITAYAYDGWGSYGEISIIITGQFLELNSIGELRNRFPGDGTVYKIKNEVIVSHWLFFRNTRYVQDNTGGIEISDPEAKIKSFLKTGDGITGLMGFLEDEFGLLQFKPIEDPGQPTASGKIPVPLPANLKQLNKGVNSYESRLVKVNTVVFKDAGKLFINGENYMVFSDQDTGVFSTSFYDADYIGKVIPDTAHITGIVLDYKGTAKLVARNQKDIERLTRLDKQNPLGASELKIWPNPASELIYLETGNLSGPQLHILINDIQGRTVLKMTHTAGDPSGIRLDSLDNGIYLIRVSDGKGWQTGRFILVR